MTDPSPFSQQHSGPRYLFLSKQFEQYLAELDEFVSHRQGIAVISGAEGVGKTMLVHTLLERLPRSFQPLIITWPAAEPLAITIMMAQSMGIDLMQGNLVNLSLLGEAIQGAAQQEEYFLLIIDDAHVLMDQHLEEIYVLSQMEHQGRQLLPIILVGRQGLLHKLATDKNQRLRDLVRLNLVVTELSFEETTQYIDHRLQQAGSSFQDCFTEDCSDPLFSRTGGIPRLINQVCDQVLNRARQEHLVRVTPDLIGWEEPAHIEEPLSLFTKYRTRTKFGILGAALLILSLIGYGVYSHYYRIPIYHLMPIQTSSKAVDKAAWPTETWQDQSPLSNSERKKIEGVLRQVREAQLKKDINLFVGAYSPAFPGLEDKKEKLLKTWKRYNYLDLHFIIENISQKNAHSIVAKVIWDITLEDVRSKEKRNLLKKFTVHFSDDSGEWVIQKISQEGKQGWQEKLNNDLMMSFKSE